MDKEETVSVWVEGGGYKELQVAATLSARPPPKHSQKIDEWAQTANFSVLSRLRQDLCAENPKKQENKRN